MRLFYLLGYAAIAVFGYGVYVQICKYRRGAALQLDGGLWARFGAMLGSVLDGRTVSRRVARKNTDEHAWYANACGFTKSATFP